VRNFSGPKSKTYHKPADQSDGNQHRLMQKITNSSSSLLLKVSPENAYKRLSMISEQEDDFASN
jgi:hypothetical protein